MMRIKIISVGKTKEPWLEEAMAEYVKRLQAVIDIKFEWATDNDQLLRLAEKEQSVICLDPQGTAMSSEKFASCLRKNLEKGGSRLTFIIGGAEGLPESLRSAKQLISLSQMTFTHQISRLIIIEQIYRASEIWKGTNYHK